MSPRSTLPSFAWLGAAALALFALAPALAQEGPGAGESPAPADDGRINPGFPLDDTASPPAAPDPDACPAREVWPGEAWADRSAEVKAQRAEAVAALEAWAFPELSPEQEAAREGRRTEGLLIIQGGEVLYERYDRGFDADDAHLTWSVSKTWTNAITGLAVQQGALDVEDSICDYVEAGNPENCEIKVRHLLEFGSGLSWRETYEGDPPTTSSVIAMLYGEGRHDMASFVAAQPRRAPAGSVYQYSSGDTVLLSAVVQAAMAPTAGRDFPWDMIFEPLGMKHVTWERDAAGTLVGSSYVWAPPRDMARLGYLFLNDGCWQGERLLPAGWVAASTVVNPSARQGTLDRDPGSATQGRQVWLNQPLSEAGEAALPWPDVPPDAYAARGHWKQAIAVIPSQDLVIVRVGDDRDDGFSYNTLFKLAAALAEPAPWPEPELGEPSNTATNASTSAMAFETGLLGIGTAYGAKLACSCRYVSGMDEDYCRTWVKASPDLVKVRFDDEAKRVKARALGFAPSAARWVSERDGCVLE